MINLCEIALSWGCPLIPNCNHNSHMELARILFGTIQFFLSKDVGFFSYFLWLSGVGFSVLLIFTKSSVLEPWHGPFYWDPMLLLWEYDNPNSWFRTPVALPISVYSFLPDLQPSKFIVEAIKSLVMLAMCSLLLIVTPRIANIRKWFDAVHSACRK